MTLKDFLSLVRYQKHDLLRKQRITLPKALFPVALYKIIYYSYIIVLPIIFSGMPWHTSVIRFFIMHITAGLLLSCIFQPAHVMEDSPFSLPVDGDDNKRMVDSWAVHQLLNTTNFAPHNILLSWCIGGLNYQIEHHLFTEICHVHYKKYPLL
jgi:linoleoyl-CoA desaturase